LTHSPSSVVGPEANNARLHVGNVRFGPNKGDKADIPARLKGL
jgi:hypothetical protein